MEKRLRPWVLLACLWVLLLCFGCSKPKDSADAPRLLGPENRFTDLVSGALPDYIPEDCHPSRLYSSVHQGNLAQCLDVQAVPVQKGVYSPQIALTVVFAVDRSRTSLRPDSWEALGRAELPVTYADNALFRRILLASAAYGLEGSNYSVRSALDWLERLYLQGNLVTEDAAVTLCFDTEAVRRIQQGEDLEILVPTDGTLTFTWGLYSREPLELELEDALLQAGYRLPDGRVLCPDYPEDYSSAVPVEDYERFLTQTQDATRDIRRSVRHVRLMGSADGRESTMLFFFAIIAVLAWAASALHRSSGPEIRRWVWLLALQSTSWLLVTMFKYEQLESSALTRMLWYSYYLFLMGLPLTMLYIAAVIDRPGPGIPRWLAPILALYPLLVLLVFTNDFHNLVFRFPNPEVWEQGYTYSFGYFLIFAYCILSFLASLILLILKSRKSPKRLGRSGPIFAAALIVGYNVCYILKVPLVQDSNLTLMFCLFSVLFAEAALSAGLLPTNTHYRELFSSSPLSMQLLDRQGRTILAAADAEPLTQLQRIRIQSGVTSLLKDDNTLLHARPIHGGTALWQEDLTLLNRQQEKLCTSIRQMEAANALLHQEGEIRRRKIASEIQIQLFDQLEADLRDKTQELASLIRNLPRDETRKQQISRIPLLLCHIKRRSNLFFLARQGQEMNGNELTVYLDELSEFSSYAGVHALVRCGISGTVSLEAATLCYDFYFSMLSWALEDSRAVLIGRLEQQNGCLEFSILSSEQADAVRFPESFHRELSQAGGSLSIRNVEESQSLCLSIPGKGGETP